MTSDLIRRGALLEKAVWMVEYDESGCGVDLKAVPIEDVLKAPAVDAVEVVRCKECKWFNSVGCAIYIVDESDKPKENDFCSYGERRVDDDRT
jgi:hypothetical protein